MHLDPADLDVLTAAAAVLGLELAVNPGSELSDALAAGAEAATDGHGPPPTPVELVEALSRAYGLSTSRRPPTAPESPRLSTPPAAPS